MTVSQSRRGEIARVEHVSPRRASRNRLFFVCSSPFFLFLLSGIHLLFYYFPLLLPSNHDQHCCVQRFLHASSSTSSPFCPLLECQVVISIATNNGLAFPSYYEAPTASLALFLSPFRPPSLSSPRRLCSAAACFDHGLFRLFLLSQNV